MKATTSTTGNTYIANCEVSYSVDAKLAAAVKKVFRRAARWKRECTIPDGFGCDVCSRFDELLEPLKKFKFISKTKKKGN